MGLDVYLYRYDNFDLTTRLEAEYETRSEAIWKDVCGDGDYNSIPEDKKARARQLQSDLRTSMGLGDYGEDTERKHRIEINSAKHPDLMFKIGYLRSSYNDGGLNSVLRTLLDEDSDLYYIFQPDDRYQFRPDWKVARQRTLYTLNRLRDFYRKNGCLFVFDVSIMDYGHGTFCKDEHGALESFLQERAKHDASPHKGSDDFQSYSSSRGYFYMGEPIRVRAIMPGNARFGSTPTAYIVAEADRAEEDSWHVKALEVTVEMCDWVLEQPDVDKYYLHWSS